MDREKGGGSDLYLNASVHINIFSFEVRYGWHLSRVILREQYLLTLISVNMFPIPTTNLQAIVDCSLFT